MTETMEEKQPLYKQYRLSDEHVAVLGAIVNSNKERVTTSEIREYLNTETTVFVSLNANQIRHRVKESLNAESETGKHKYLLTEQPASDNNMPRAKEVWIVPEKRDEVEQIVASYDGDLSVNNFEDLEAAFSSLVSRQEELQQRINSLENTVSNSQDTDVSEDISELKQSVKNLQSEMKKLQNNQSEIAGEVDTVTEEFSEMKEKYNL